MYGSCMKWFDSTLSRRKFLKNGAIAMVSAAMLPKPYWGELQQEFPDAERLGRICVGKVEVRTKPDVSAESVGTLYEDAIVVWLREVIGKIPNGRQSARWVETPDGYIYAPNVQPVRNLPNIPVDVMPETPIGKGMWIEVSVPQSPIFLVGNNPQSGWLKYAIETYQIPKLYYSQVIWVDDVKTDSDGTVLYRVNEKFGPGDIFWIAGAACRPITEEEIEPILPNSENKKVVIDVSTNRQILSCVDGNTEIYTCVISSGAYWNSEGQIVREWGTPIGDHQRTWRKLISIHMSGGTTGAGYDLPGVGWTNLFAGTGVAIHSTFWHNDFGTPRSHGCINCAPDDAKFVFRFTNPRISLYPGDQTVGMPGGTGIYVSEVGQT